MLKSGKLKKIERVTLQHCSNGPSELPKGCGSLNRYNLLDHRWLRRVDREYNFGPERYITTDEGLAALAADAENFN